MAPLEINALAQLSLDIIDRFSIIGLLRGRPRVDLRQQQLALLKELTDAGIDPQLFDLLLSTELDRRLKARFGLGFFAATVAFAAASYAIVVLNGIYKWGISDVAITGLIFETPLQFIGILYIIARNLFPQAPGKEPTTTSTVAPRRARAKSGPGEPSAQ